MAQSHAAGILSVLDYAIIVLYLLLTLVVGARFIKRQKSAEDYFVAGRSIAWLPAAISVIATVFSAISFVGVPAESFQHNIQLFGSTLVIPLVTYFVIALFLRFFRGMNLVSAYEYLERRFNAPVRLLASALFIMLRISWMAVILYATALVTTEISDFTVPQAVLMMGVVTVAYTFMGGMAAVIWTDVLQFFVFIAGIVCIAVVASAKIDGGLWHACQIASQHDKLRLFDLSLDPTTRITTWGVLVGGFFLNLSIYGVDQMVIQRYLATRSISQARRTLWFNGIFVAPMVFLLYLLGVFLFAFYKVNPELAAGLKNPDRVLPYFIAREMPHGMSGFVIAAIFAATMSSISSGINSLSTAVVFDFYRRGKRASLPIGHYLNLSRALTAGVGILIIVLGMLVGRIGSVMEMVYKLNSPFLGVLLGVFLLGILTKRANAPGVIVGIAFGSAAVSVAVFATRVSFMWYSVIACLPTFVIGYLASLFWARPNESRIDGLTYASRVAGERRAGENAEERVTV